MIKSVILNKDNIGDTLYDFSYNILSCNEDWIIGGGFARFVGGVYFDLSYLKDESLFNYLYHSGGDIDLFSDRKKDDIILNSLLPNSDIGKLILNVSANKGFRNKFNVNSYESKFANNVILSLKKNKSDDSFWTHDKEPFRCKFQYIHEYCYNSPESMLMSFDINNSKWCLKIEDNKLKLIYDTDALLCDKYKLVGISSATKNPFLSERISKYVYQRGMSKGVSNESHANLKKYIVNILNEEWDKKFITIHEHVFTTHVKSNVKSTDKFLYELDRASYKSINKLLKCNVVSANDLALFIGKWKVSVLDKSQDYNYDFTFGDKYIEVDWATNKIQNMS